MNFGLEDGALMFRRTRAVNLLLFIAELRCEQGIV